MGIELVDNNAVFTDYASRGPISSIANEFLVAQYLTMQDIGFAVQDANNGVGLLAVAGNVDVQGGRCLSTVAGRIDFPVKYSGVNETYIIVLNYGGLLDGEYSGTGASGTGALLLVAARGGVYDFNIQATNTTDGTTGGSTASVWIPKALDSDDTDIFLAITLSDSDITVYKKTLNGASTTVVEKIGVPFEEGLQLPFATHRSGGTSEYSLFSKYNTVLTELEVNDIYNSIKPRLKTVGVLI